jgi:hypothetical protein
MPPTKVIFIRHAEKQPDTGGPPFGFDVNGNSDSHSLIARGWSRAGALVAFFTSPRPPIEKPDYVFAAAPDMSHHSLHGQRPSQTVAPLCEVLGTPANQTYRVGQESQLATAIKAEGGVVLVCWEHHTITSIVQGLLDNPTFATQWPDRFDLVWLFTANAWTYDFATANQHLLSGDQ